MFIPIWLIFIGSGTLMAIWALVWGVKNRQFEDQDRARYLPFAGLTPLEMSRQPPVRRGFTFYVIMTMLACGPLSVLWGLYVVLQTM